MSCSTISSSPRPQSTDIVAYSNPITTTEFVINQIEKLLGYKKIFLIHKPIQAVKVFCSPLPACNLAASRERWHCITSEIAAFSCTAIVSYSKPFSLVELIARAVGRLNPFPLLNSFFPLPSALARITLSFKKKTAFNFASR